MNTKQALGAAAVVLGVALLSAPASAQPEWLMSGLAGLHMPMGDYGDLADMGWDGGVQIDYRVRRTFGYGADLMYNSSSGGNAGSELDFSIFQFGAHITGYLPSRGSESPVLPYAQLGLAFYNTKAEGPPFLTVTVPNGVESASDLGFNFGGGLIFMKPTSNIGFGADATWHTVFTEDESTNFLNLSGRIIYSFADRSQR